MKTILLLLLLWSLPTPGWAFTCTASIDTFDRTDANPLSGGPGWTGPMGNISAQLKIVSNQVLNASGAAAGGSYISGATYGPSTEACAQIVTFSGTDEWNIVWISSDPGSSAWDGYALEVDKIGGASNDLVKVYRIDNSTWTQLGSGTQEITGTDWAGIEVLVGATVKVFWRTNAGSWTEMASAAVTASGADLTGAAGYIGMAIVNTTDTLDSLQGGTLAGAGPVTTPGQRLMGSAK